MDLIGSETDGLLQPMVGVALTYVAVIALVRLAGVRSFARMSAFDFAATVATGSLISAAAIGAAPVWSGIAAIAALLLAQALVATLRRHGWRGLIDNRPVVLVRDGALDEDGLRRTRLTEADVAAQMRLSGVGRLADVRAMVLETSGAVSVLVNRGGDEAADDLVMRDLR